MGKLTRDRSLLGDQFEIADDFLGFTDAQLWTILDADVGASVAVDADGVGGILLLTTGATDNNECNVHSTNELFDIVADKEINIECRLQYAEANTDDANVAFGLINAPAANDLIDDGAGMRANYSGAVIFKVDGGTVWKCESSIATTQVTSTSKTTAGGATAQTLRIRILPRSSTEADVLFYVDGAQLEDTNNDAGQPFIRHTLTYTSITEMSLFVAAKAGGATSEVISVDYIAAQATR